MIKNNYVYFVYSEIEIKEKNQILSKMGKQFQPGTVIVNGVRKQFSNKIKNVTESNFIVNLSKRFPDVIVVAEGNEDQFVYENSANILKKGN